MYILCMQEGQHHVRYDDLGDLCVWNPHQPVNCFFGVCMTSRCVDIHRVLFTSHTPSRTISTHTLSNTHSHTHTHQKTKHRRVIKQFLTVPLTTSGPSVHHGGEPRSHWWAPSPLCNHGTPSPPARHNGRAQRGAYPLKKGVPRAPPPTRATSHHRQPQTTRWRWSWAPWQQRQAS